MVDTTARPKTTSLEVATLTQLGIYNCHVLKRAEPNSCKHKRFQQLMLHAETNFLLPTIYNISVRSVTYYRLIKLCDKQWSRGRAFKHFLVHILILSDNYRALLPDVLHAGGRSNCIRRCFSNAVPLNLKAPQNIVMGS